MNSFDRTLVIGKILSTFPLLKTKLIYTNSRQFSEMKLLVQGQISGLYPAESVLGIMDGSSVNELKLDLRTGMPEIFILPQLQEVHHNLGQNWLR
jgi:hypothetical protein